MSRILIAHPGASFSVHDVYQGIDDALRRGGHDLIEYRLDGRINAAAAWFKYQSKRMKRQGRTNVSYNSIDIVYKAGVDLIERALRFEPDWVLVISAMYMHPDVMIMLKRAGVRVAVLLTESPYDEIKESTIPPYVDLVWTNERSCVERLRRGNPHVYYLPHAFDPARHLPGAQPGDDDVAAHDVVFIGSYFQERIDLLSRVNWDGIDLGLYGDATWLPSRSKLRQYIRGGTQPNARTAALYRRAKIGLNPFRSSVGFGRNAPRITGAESLNPRSLELAATGCFHLCDDRAEVAEIFGGLVPTYRNPAELETLIRFWLADDRRREAVASHLPAAVAGHTFDVRARQIVADMERVAGVREPVALAAGQHGRT